MTLKTLYNHFAQNKESTWIMQPYNADALYRFVKEHPIKKVLELGTGIGFSAAIVALALKDKGETDFQIHTVEQYEKCISLARQIIPKELQENLTIHKANPIVWNTPLIAHQDFSVYDKLPGGEYDLIINDGPSPFMEGEHYLDLPNGTIIKLLLESNSILKKGTLIAYDGRLNSLGLIERFFSDNFFLVKPNNKNYFNVLERKENPPLFKDSKFESMKLSTYFNHEEKETLPSDNGPATSSQTVPPNTGA